MVTDQRARASGFCDLCDLLIIIGLFDAWSMAEHHGPWKLLGLLKL